MTVILAIIGIVLTTLFGIYPIRSNIKNRKKKISIEFKEVQCYSLFKDDIARLNIEIIYNNNVLSNALILLRARIINDGHTDIDKNRVYTPLKLISQKDFTWLDAKSILGPKGSTANVQIVNENEIQIEWDLLKSDEFIEFEAIVKVSDNQSTVRDFLNGITFDYRITDLNSIHTEEDASKVKHRRYGIKMGTIVILIGIFFLCLEFIPAFNDALIVKDIDYGILSDTILIRSKIKGKNVDNISLITENSEVKVMTIRDFNEFYKIDSIEKIYIDDFSLFFIWFMRIMGIFMIILGGLFFVTIFIKKKKKNAST